MSDAQYVTRWAVLLLGACLLGTAGGCQQARVSSGSGPLIGITSVYEPGKGEKSAETTVGFAYVRAVTANGGVPIVLPTVDDERVLQKYLDTLDGLVLIGVTTFRPRRMGSSRMRRSGC